MSKISGFSHEAPVDNARKCPICGGPAKFVTCGSPTCKAVNERNVRIAASRRRYQQKGRAPRGTIFTKECVECGDDFETKNPQTALYCVACKDEIKKLRQRGLAEAKNPFEPELTDPLVIKYLLGQGMLGTLTVKALRIAGFTDDQILNMHKNDKTKDHVNKFAKPIGYSLLLNEIIAQSEQIECRSVA